MSLCVSVAIRCAPIVRVNLQGYCKNAVQSSKIYVYLQSSRAHVVCLEVKSAVKWDRKWERPMRSLKNHGRIHVDKMIGIYTGKRAYHFDDLDVLPVEEFLKRLHRGDIF